MSVAMRGLLTYNSAALLASATVDIHSYFKLSNASHRSTSHVYLYTLDQLAVLAHRKKLASARCSARSALRLKLAGTSRTAMPALIMQHSAVVHKHSQLQYAIVYSHACIHTSHQQLSRRRTCLFVGLL
jgi:hypothetical protein